MSGQDISALKLIQELSDANGASGFEDEVLLVVRKHAKGLGEASEDSLRNLYVRRRGNKGSRPVVQLDAHTDEVSFMVQAVRPNGTLQFITLGRWVDGNVAAHKVRVRNAKGAYIPGVVASKPPHYMSDAEKAKPVSLSDMVIDVGATSREEAMEAFAVRIGEPVVPDVAFTYAADRDLMIGKAFDCRLGCAAILGTLRALDGEDLAADVVGAFASQEEVGTRGATVTANAVRPDIAIVFEGCPADDTFTEPWLTQTAIKRGPMLRHIDSRMITNPRFQRRALDLAARLGIPVQDGVRTGGSTNGAPIHLSNQGVPVIVIGLPVRYIHTHHGIASFADFTNAVVLAREIIKGIDADFIRGL